jgi:hypothetical protein
LSDSLLFFHSLSFAMVSIATTIATVLSFIAHAYITVFLYASFYKFIFQILIKLRCERLLTWGLTATKSDMIFHITTNLSRTAPRSSRPLIQ